MRHLQNHIPGIVFLQNQAPGDQTQYESTTKSMFQQYYVYICLSRSAGFMGFWFCRGMERIRTLALRFCREVSPIMFPQRWFKAEDHHADLVNFARNWRGDRTVHVLDCFGYSRSISCLAITKLADACRHLQKHDKYIQILAIYGNFLLGWPGAGHGGAMMLEYARNAGPKSVFILPRSQWNQRGYFSSAFDLLLDSSHDVVSTRGFQILLNMALAFLGHSKPVISLISLELRWYSWIFLGVFNHPDAIRIDRIDSSSFVNVRQIAWGWRRAGPS